MRKIILLAAIALSMAGMEIRAGEATPFNEGERVLFLGDSIARGGAWHSMVSLFYETRFPERRITWLNAGISGDTAAGALQRLQWDVLDRKPSTVVIMFGMNECGRPDLPGKMGSDERVELYSKSMKELVLKLKKAGIRTVLCTPSPYDATADMPSEAKPEINAALTRCAQVTRELAAEDGLPLVDFNGPMNKIASDFQKTNPKFTLIGNDRIHPGELGCTIMASLFLQAQGVSSIVSETVVDAATGQVASVSNCAVKELSANGGDLTFSLIENSLPMPFEGKAREALHLSADNELEKSVKSMKNPREAHVYPGWKRLPIQESLNRQILRVTNLVAGDYELLIDDQSVGLWSETELAAGLNLAGVRSTPQYRQALQVSDTQAKIHQISSYGPRMIAFTRLYTLMPARVDEKDNDAVKTVLEKLISDPAAKDNPDLGNGGYAQTMAKKYLECKPKEAETAAAITAAEDEVYKKNRPVSHIYRLRKVAHPLSSEQRQAVFATRHSPEQVEKTAKEFLDLLITDNSDLMRSNLRMRKGFQAVADLAKANKPVDALNAWRDYLFSKLCNPGAYGLPEALLDPYRGVVNPADAEKTLARAEELMQDKVVADVAPMPPGCVWLPPKSGCGGTTNPWRPATFQPLAAAFILTGERRFLDKWLEYIDDWAMNENTDGSMRPTELGDSTNSFGSQIPVMYQTLAGIARTMPLKQKDFPADTLARILGKLIRVYPPGTLVYFESNPQNWTPGSATGLMKSTMLMDEFKAAEYIFNRARHRQENYPTTEGLPDGSETEHALWYNRHVYTSCEQVLELAAARRHVPVYQRPSWEAVLASPSWDLEERSTRTGRARYLLQMLTPQGQNPIGNRNDHRPVPGVENGEEFDLFAEAPDLRVLTDTLRGNSAAGLPEFTMSAFPYSGSWLMRTGWSKDSGYAHFFCSPYPTGGHALAGMKSNNSLYLSHAGQDLLVNGGFGNYSYCRSPLRVDRKEQFAQAGISHGDEKKGHKGFGIAYMDPQPAPWRSHSSNQFDFAEGSYNGPYGDSVDDHHDLLAYLVDFLAERARTVITGISHRRQVFFVKDPGLWIVVDRMQSAIPHEYSVDWRLPVAPVKQFEGRAATKFSGKTFTPETIKIDNDSQSVITAGAEMSNIGIRHFGPQMTFSAMRDDGETIKDDYTLRYKLYDFWQVSGCWKSTGNDLMISLIEVIPAGGASKIQATEPLGDGRTTRGFKAITSSGKTVSFMSAVNGSEELAIGNFAIKGETLLVVKGRVRGTSAGDEEESISGIVLDCKSMSIARQPVNIPHTDFEFSPDSNSTPDTRTRPSRLATMPIWNPIHPVQIYPASTVITGAEPITLSSSTPGVEIRYTLDGGEPTLQSQLYNGPFTIAGNATVKARAFRQGLTQVPANLAGTHATVTAAAYFRIQTPLAPVAATGDKLYQAGLKADYSEGDWKDLIFFPERIKPLQSRGVRNLFDLCAPNIEKVFGWTYSGMLAIPEDGVYTFHAPKEMTISPQEPGYALRLFVGQETISGRTIGRLNEWYPATTRHAYGTWSIALKKGLHPFKLIYVDYRTDAAERLNHPGMRQNIIWDGKVPDLRVSGPGMQKQPIPKEWFFKSDKTENKK